MKSLPHKKLHLNVVGIIDGLIALASDIKPLGIETVAISSNSVITHPQDGPEKMAEDARSFGMPVCSSNGEE